MWTSKSFIARTMRSKNRHTLITVVILGILIIGFLFAYAAYGEESNKLDTLRMVHIVFRHGERTPTAAYKTDPYRDPKHWPEGWGQLTNKGKLSLYELGRSLSKRYIKITERYSPANVKVVSTASPRCQMSAMTLLAGLFPPQQDQIWNQNLLWQPIPIDTISRSQDNIIASKANCPAFTSAKLQSDSELERKLSKEQISAMDTLSFYTGQNVTTILEAESIYSTLLIERERGLVLPDWTKKVFPEPLQSLAALSLASFTQTPLMRKLQAGVMVGNWRTHMQEARLPHSEQIPKLYLYSGHDLTLVNILRALGDEDPTLPGYGAWLGVELHLIHGHYFVKMAFYNSAEHTKGKPVVLEGCSNPCSLDTFLRITQDLVPEDWHSLCQTAPI